jgi:hypothetical protein
MIELDIGRRNIAADSGVRVLIMKFTREKLAVREA